MTVECKGPDIETASDATPRRVRREQLLVFAAAALIVVSLFLEGAEGPEEGASGEQIRTQLEDGMGALSLQVLGGSLAFLGFVLFTVGIRSLARRRGGDPVLLDLTLLAGGLMAVWMWLQASVDAIPLVAADDNGQLDHYADTTLPALEFLTGSERRSGTSPQCREACSYWPSRCCRCRPDCCLGGSATSGCSSRPVPWSGSRLQHRARRS